MSRKSFLIAGMIFLVIFVMHYKALAETVIIKTEPPRVVITSEPELIVIPGTYVYYVKADDNDIFFYQGFWWRQWSNEWYRSGSYSGPWHRVHPRRVPHGITRIPPRWRETREDNVRVRWHDVRKNWREWERNKHWEKRGWRREVVRGQDRDDRENEERGMSKEGRRDRGR